MPSCQDTVFVSAQRCLTFAENFWVQGLMRTMGIDTTGDSKGFHYCVGDIAITETQGAVLYKALFPVISGSRGRGAVAAKGDAPSLSRAITARPSQRMSAQVRAEAECRLRFWHCLFMPQCMCVCVCACARAHIVPVINATELWDYRHG